MGIKLKIIKIQTLKIRISGNTLSGIIENDVKSVNN
jgi:hypothetical protein